MYALGIVAMVLNVVIKLALRAHSLEEWLAIAEKKPRVAALVRLLDALGISPISVVQSLIDLVRNTASPGTMASARAMSVSASKPLIAPPDAPKACCEKCGRSV
jgi:hypothetical protein